jgi:hypothetical protein
MMLKIKAANPLEMCEDACVCGEDGLLDGPAAPRLRALGVRSRKLSNLRECRSKSINRQSVVRKAR